MGTAADPIAAGLATIRRLRRISWITFFCMPVIYLGAWVSPSLGFVLGAIWCVATLAAAFFACSSRCPRCGLPFYYKIHVRRHGGPFFNRKALTWRNCWLTLLGLHCLNCGLLLRESVATGQTHTPSAGV